MKKNILRVITVSSFIIFILILVIFSLYLFPRIFADDGTVSLNIENYIESTEYEKEIFLEESDIFDKCLDDFFSHNNSEVIDTLAHDINNDGVQEFLILSNDSILYNSRKLHVYQVENDSISYCGAVSLLQSNLNDNIFNPSAKFESYDKIEVKRYKYLHEQFNVLTYSVNNSSSQYNHIDAIKINDEGIVESTQILMWGIDKIDTYNGREYVEHNLFCLNKNQQEITSKELQKHLTYLY